MSDLEAIDDAGNCVLQLEERLGEVVEEGARLSVESPAKLRFTRREVFFEDLIRGELSKPLDSMRDLVLVRSDGSPVFHLANVSDDMHQNISHIVRGDDHVENTYRHLFIYWALGAAPPRYAHLPMIVNEQGKPYSKRDGDAFVGDLREKGYLPDAVFNYLTLLGWSPGDDREKMNRDEIVEAFSLERVQRTPAQMDLRKLQNLNGMYMAELPLEEFVRQARVFAEEYAWGRETDSDYFKNVASLMQSRTKLFSDVGDWEPFFVDLPSYDEKACRKILRKPGIPKALQEARAALAECRFTEECVEECIHSITDKLNWDRGKLNQPLRVAVTGKSVGAGIYETLALLGCATTCRRLDYAIENCCQDTNDETE